MIELVFFVIQLLLPTAGPEIFQFSIEKFILYFPAKYIILYYVYLCGKLESERWLVMGSI